MQILRYLSSPSVWALLLVLAGALCSTNGFHLGAWSVDDCMNRGAATPAGDDGWRGIRVGQTPVPGAPCGTVGLGCVGTSVTRIPPTTHPCAGLMCGSAGSCSGTAPDCGRCFLQSCVAVGSAWVASTSGSLTICSNGVVQSSCGSLIDSRGVATVLREEYFCVLSAGGCSCDSNAGSTKVPCPCAVPAASLLINPCR